jgi:hypothetical protein
VSLWYPREYEHNELLNLYGDSPYYHVSQSIYQSLRTYGGYTPSAANPFATKSMLDAKIDQSAQKSAWGTCGHVNYETSRYFIIDTDAGTVSDGNYYGDIGFNNPPAAFAGMSYCQALSTKSHTYIVRVAPPITSSYFRVYGAVSAGELYRINWMCVGD